MPDSSRNMFWQSLDVGKDARSTLKGQKTLCLWFTGLSGAGKSTLANLLEKRLHETGRHTYLLDGDNIRQGSTGIWVLPRPIASRISVVWPRSPG